MIKCIESGIAGKGLGFDYLISIKEKADKLNVVGTVFIKEDGSIKIIAEGKDENLEKFTKKIKSNYSSCGIENFYVLRKNTDIQYTKFSIN